MHRFRWALLLGSIVMLLVIMTAIWRSPYPHRARVLLHDMAQTKAATYRNARGEAMAYRLLFPFGYQRGAQEIRYPLVISLHGDGCSGSDNVKQLTHVFPALSTAAMRQQYPCFVLAPQCPARTYWVDKHLLSWCYCSAIPRADTRHAPVTGADPGSATTLSHRSRAYLCDRLFQRWHGSVGTHHPAPASLCRRRPTLRTRRPRACLRHSPFAHLGLPRREGPCGGVRLRSYHGPLPDEGGWTSALHRIP